MEKITKEGKIIKIKDNKITVRINSCSACAGCSAKNFCTLSENKSKDIEITGAKNDKYHVGDKVFVHIDISHGFKAVILSYVLPLVLMLSTLVIMSCLQYSDFICGISSIIVLIPYYFGLFFSRNKTKSGFEFKISEKDATKNG